MEVVHEHGGSGDGVGCRGALTALMRCMASGSRRGYFMPNSLTQRANVVRFV